MAPSAAKPLHAFRAEANPPGGVRNPAAALSFRFDIFREPRRSPADYCLRKRHPQTLALSKAWSAAAVCRRSYPHAVPALGDLGGLRKAPAEPRGAALWPDPGRWFLEPTRLVSFARGLRRGGGGRTPRRSPAGWGWRRRRRDGE